MTPIRGADVFVTRHALARLREHCPAMGVRGARSLVDEGREVPGPWLAPFLARRPGRMRTDRYLLTRDGDGVLVVAVGFAGFPSPWSLVTYLPFTDDQRRAVADALRYDPPVLPAAATTAPRA